MNAQKQHVTFWRTMAKNMSEGVPLTKCLESTQKKLAGTPLGEAAGALLRSIREGRSLSQAMADCAGVFSPSEQVMVRAGEAGGVLDVVAKRIEEAIEDGSFRLPGVKETGTEAEHQARWFRAFGRLISSGVPILQVLHVLAEEAPTKDERALVQRVHDAVRNGATMSEAVGECVPDMPPQVTTAIRLAEDRGDLDACAFRIADAIEDGDLSSLVPAGVEIPVKGESEDEGPVITLVTRILKQAFTERASDVHVEPHRDGVHIRYRVDGVLREAEPLPAKLASAVISRLKLMASLNLAERRLPQDGRIMLNIEGKEVDLRVSTVPTVHGERITIRILDRSMVFLTLDRIGLAGDTLESIRSLCRLPNGLVICTGPTGSGKTTLLYAMLSEVNNVRTNVMSVEDPVEYDIKGVSQIQVFPAIGLTFARVIRSMLRQDPDVIMVGEIRDLETAQMCVQAALTGHLVLTTLHTNTAPAALNRLLDIGLEPFLVNSVVAGCVAQRLVRTLCKDCKQEAKPDLNALPPEVGEFIAEMGYKTFWAPKGCSACNGTGYRGRTAIHEVLIPDDGVRKAVSESAKALAVYRAALAAGMRPMLLDGVRKAAEGITSLREVLRVSGLPPRG